VISNDWLAFWWGKSGIFSSRYKREHNNFITNDVRREFNFAMEVI
jgi:hypothetical protein